MKGYRYARTNEILSNMKVIIYARENNPRENTIVQQLEICQNFADFYDYEVVGVALDINTLFNTQLEFDAVLAKDHACISRDALEYMTIKNRLLARDIIIIKAVRSF